MITVNGERDVFLNETVEQLIERLNIEVRGIAVALDGEVILRSAWASTTVLDESSVEIVTAVAGG
jgi:sulfur carrier protein